MTAAGPVDAPLGVALLWAGSYLLGGVPVGWLVGRAVGVDLRRVGTGKIGTSNVYRTVGLAPAALVGPLQFAQGLAPVVTADLLGGPTWVVAGAGLMAVIGNGWPFYFRYNGGRGVATATGAVALWSWIGLGCVLVLLAVGGALRRSGLGVLMAYLSLPVVLAASRDPRAYSITSVGVLLCLLLRRFEGYRIWPLGERDPGDDWRRRLVDDWRPGPEEPDRRIHS
ncbi:MAG: glycerol-3-phosphate acyltransferase [Candidatus Dormiibacterota bacterium]